MTPESSLPVLTVDDIEALLDNPDEQYRFLVNESNDILAIHAPDGTLRWISPAVERLLGWTPAERMAMASDLVHEDDHGVVAEVQSRLTAGADSATGRIRVGHKDGTFRWADSTARALRGPDGRVVALVIVTRIVHEQVLAEFARAEAEERYRLIAENAGDVVLQTTKGGAIAWISPSVVDVLGWVPTQVIGQEATDFVHPDDLASVAAGALQIRSGVQATGRGRARRADGSYRWFDWAQRAATTQPGQAPAFVTTLRDIQSEVEAEKALAASLQFYRLLAENTSDVVVMLGTGGVLEWVSPAASRTLKWDPDAVVGTRDIDYVHPDDFARFELEAPELDDPERHHAMSFRLRRGDGTYIWVEAVSQITALDDGTRHVRIVRLRDIEAAMDAFQELTRSEERFRSAMENAGIGMCLSGRDGLYLEVNSSLCEYLGRSADDLKSRTWQELTHPDDLPADLVNIGRIESGDENSYRLSKRFIRSDGTTVYADMAVTGVRTTSGDLDYFIAQIVDVTEQVRAREALEASEEHYRLLAENASDVVIHLRDGIIRWVSPSLQDALGWRPADWIGQVAMDLIHPADHEVQSQKTGRITAGETVLYRVRVRTPLGPYRWCEVHARPYVDSDGQVFGVAASFRIIDKEIEAQEALARSDELFRAAMESAPTGMAVIDLDRRFLEVNPALCRMLDRDEEWLKTHRVPDILAPEDDSVDLRMRAEVLSGSLSSVAREKRFVRADGSLLWCEHSIGVLNDDDGIPRGFVSQFVNITEARRAREELRFMATHDSLTRLVNRPELLTRMDQMLTHPPRTGTEIATLFVDLDGLKAINDTYGHAIGDAVIVSVAERLRDVVRAGDIVARLGGDEFVIVLPAIHSVEDAEHVAEKIQHAIAEPLTIDSITLEVTLSIGISMAARDANPDRVLEFADRALYEAKRSGGGRTVIYEPGD